MDITEDMKLHHGEDDIKNICLGLYVNITTVFACVILMDEVHEFILAYIIYQFIFISSVLTQYTSALNQA